MNKSEMGRRLNLAHLTEEECEQVLQVIQRDFELRQKERERLSKIEEEVKEEHQKVSVLAKEKKFNDNCCMRCFSRFVFLINSKVQCIKCQYNTCKDCSTYDRMTEKYICKVCLKQGELQNQTLGWFYDNIKNKFKRFGSAKVVRSLYKRRTDSDSEAETYNEINAYNTDPLTRGRLSRPALHGLFEDDRSSQGLPQERREEVIEDIIAVENKIDRNIRSPYSCSVSTGREKFDDAKKRELQTFSSQLKLVIRDIQRTLDHHSPSPGHRQERDLLSNQQFQLSSILSNLSQSLHIAVDNQDPSDSPASPVARHQLIKDILVKEVTNFVGKPIILSPISRDGPQSYEEDLANILLNKVVDDYHQEVLNSAREEEEDVRRSFTKLSNKATIEQLNDNYISESETDVASSRIDEQTDGELSDFNESQGHLIKGQVHQQNNRIPNHKESPESSFRDQLPVLLDTFDSSLRGPVENDSGIVSSPTGILAPRDEPDSVVLNTHPPESVHEQNTAVNDRSSPIEDRDTPTNTLFSSFANNDNVIMRGSTDMLGTDEEWDAVTSKMTTKPNAARAKRLDRNQNLLMRRSLSSSSDKEGDNFTKNNIINEKWNVVESRKSRVLSEYDSDSPRYSSNATLVTSSSINSPNTSFKHNDDVFSSTAHNISQSEIRELKTTQTQTESISYQVNNDDNAEESDSTIEEDRSSSERSPVTEPKVHKHLVVKEKIDPFGVSDDEDDKFVDSESKKNHFPLPSFLGNSKLSFETRDLDDISSNPVDDEDTVSNFSTEISFGRTWNFSGTETLFRDSGRISAYDNFGKKKVGLDVEGGPVLMLVPDTNQDGKIIKVGDTEVGDLSDLSENEDRSEPSLSNSESLDEDDISNVKDAMRQILRQKASEKASPASKISNGLTNGVDTSHPDDSYRAAKPSISQESLLALELVSIDSENGDPKFLVKPADVTVEEGEVARFSCKVTGTEPIDVFWHKEGMELVQLNEEDSCESRSDNNSFYLDMYNTTLACQAQILCIAVNDSGRCVQGVRLIVQASHGERKAPEFIKGLHNIEVKVGSRVKFRVKLSGYPQPKVTWFKDGKKLVNSFGRKIEKQGNRDYMLSLDAITLEDDAEYTIIARNIAGEARSSAQLIVNDDDDSDGELSSMSSSRYSLPLSPPPSLFSPPVHREPLSIPDHLQSLYPDTDELLRLAEKVSQTRGDVTTTANKMLRSAGTMSTLHQKLDDMDKKLNDLEKDAKDTDQVAMETEVYKEIVRDDLLREHDEMQTSASAIRNVTSTAMEILQSAQERMRASHSRSNSESSNDSVVMNKDSQGVKRKSELLSPTSTDQPKADEVELKINFVQFDKLYNVGKISREQMTSGLVPRSLYDECMEYLRQEAQFEQEEEMSHDLTADDLPTSIDCGLKRVDSKRYKRDYVINREQPKKSPTKWEVKLPPVITKEKFEPAEVVKSTPAGKREDAHEKINEAQEQMDVESDRDLYIYGHQTDYWPRYSQQNLPPIDEINQVEDEIYLAAGRVTHLQSKIENLEDKVRDDDDKSLPELEDEIVRAAAQVKNNEKQVSLVEEHVQKLKTQTFSASAQDEDEPTETYWRKMLSPVRERPPSVSNDWARRAGSTPWSPPDKVRVTAEVTLSSPPARNVPMSPSPVVQSSPFPASPSPAQSVASQPITPPRTTPPPGEIPPPVPKTPPPVLITPPTPEAIYLHGETPAEVLPESRTEFEESIRLPSVKSLRSMFNQSVSTEDKKGGAVNVKRVYSLTGRDLPKTIREKLKDQSALVQNPNIRSQDQQRQQLTSLFEQQPKQEQQQASELRITLQSTTPVNAPAAITSPGQQPYTSSGASSVRDTSRHLSSSSISTAISTPMNHPVRSASTSSIPPSLAKSSINPPYRRQSSSTIMARAKFWDTRIIQEVASDADAHVDTFPEMPVDSFKQ